MCKWPQFCPHLQSWQLVQTASTSFLTTWETSHIWLLAKFNRLAWKKHTIRWWGSCTCCDFTARSRSWT
jgi:hypothetical protein